MKPKAPSCGECGAQAKLVGGGAVYPHRPDLAHKRFWLCACGAYVGCHPSTEHALGTPAGPLTRQARIQAHNAFDPLWQKPGSDSQPLFNSRSAAYRWLEQELGYERGACHIGEMTAAEAERVENAALKAQAMRRGGHV